MQSIASSVFSFLFSLIVPVVPLRVMGQWRSQKSDVPRNLLAQPGRQRLNGARCRRKLEVGFQCRCLPNTRKGKVSKKPLDGRPAISRSL